MCISNTWRKEKQKQIVWIPSLIVNMTLTSILSLFFIRIDVKKVARRPRKSPFPMLAFDEACKIVMEHAKCLTKETVSIGG